VTVSIALPLVSITGSVNEVAVSVAVSVTVSGDDRLQYLALISSGHGEPMTGKGRLTAYGLWRYPLVLVSVAVSSLGLGLGIGEGIGDREGVTAIVGVGGVLLVFNRILS